MSAAPRRKKRSGKLVTLEYSYVSDLASLCSLASMKTLLDQQVALPSTVSNLPQDNPNGAARVQAHAAERLLQRSFTPPAMPYPNYSVRPASGS
jgi:hypothetical protein